MVELVVGGLVLALSVFSWMALLLLDNHIGWLADTSLTAAVALVCLLAITWFGARRPRLCLDGGAGLAVGVAVAVAAVFFFPGFHYGITDKDPGAYVEIGAAFARHGSYSFVDTLAKHFPGVAYFDPGERFPAIWVQHGLIVPQFYHLWPALLAMAYDVGGLRLEVAMAPLCGLLAVAVFVLLVRRLVAGRASVPAATAGGVLLATNMLQVWQSKYPTTEAFSEMVFVSMLLGIVICLQANWAPAAGIAGLLLGVGWLERPDMLVSAAVAAGVGAVIFALRRWDVRCWWFLAGFSVTLPHVLWQAYAGARKYTMVAGVPRLHTIVAGAVVMYLLAAIVRYATPLRAFVTGVLERRKWQFGLGLSVCIVALAGMALGFLRPRLFGRSYQYAGPVLVRSFNEENMRRLAWFITYPGWALAGIGVAVIALRRWRASQWVVLTPALLIIPVYIQNARIAPVLMWWGRRFVPEVLPLLLCLIVVALAAIASLASRARLAAALPAVALFVYLVSTFVSESAPLRHHDEFGGSFRLTSRIAATAGSSRGVYLFTRDPCCTNTDWLFGGAMWLERGEYSAVMPPPPAQLSYVRALAAAMPGHPVFAVLSGQSPPPGLAAAHPIAVLRVRTTLPVWQQSYTSLPDGPGTPVPVNFTVWRLALG